MTLSRSFLNGALAIAGITAAFGFATKAQAFTVSQLINAGSTGVQVGDKLFSDFMIPTGTNLFDLTDTVNIDDNGGSFDIDFRASGGLSSSISAAGTIKYKVTIVAPFTNTFDMVDIQSSTTGGALPGKTATRTFTSTGGLSPSPLTAINNGTDGGTFLLSPSSISVEDSWSFTGTGGRNSLTSIATSFVQDPPLPAVPEPSAVLGLLALGLCGASVGRKKG